MTTLTQRMNVVEENLQSIRLTLDTLLQNLLNPALMVPGTLRFGGNRMQLDQHGIQIATRGSTLSGLYMVDKLSANPNDDETEGLHFEALIDGPAGQTNFAIKSIAGSESVGLSLSKLDNSNAEARLRATYHQSSAEVEVMTGSTYRLIRLSNASFAVASNLTPAQITANQDDYDPTNLVNAFALRLSTDASRDITGINPGPLPTGRQLFLFNIGSFNIVLKNDVTSTAAYRFLFPADITLAPNEGIGIWYDDTSSRWRCFGRY